MINHIMYAAHLPTAASTVVHTHDELNDSPTTTYQSLPLKANQIESTMSLLTFIRSYRINGIAIVDFILIYVGLLTLNCCLFHLDRKFLFLAMIPLTILINIATEPQAKFDWINSIILLISIYLMIVLQHHL